MTYQECHPTKGHIHDRTRMDRPTDRTRMDHPTDRTRMDHPTDRTRMDRPTDRTRMDRPTDCTRMEDILIHTTDPCAKRNQHMLSSWS
ncbi:hypothetical protein [Ktedonospora formicarum]|uniref:hypothetical protein n=1 Tax=Ktedonospora formicarum TaxID=2778364 RepID=UPI001C68DA53|nr:hypothetical protein [Ktedonospora formicarum]